MPKKRKSKKTKLLSASVKKLNQKQLGALVLVLALIGIGSIYWFKIRAASNVWGGYISVPPESRRWTGSVLTTGSQVCVASYLVDRYPSLGGFIYSKYRFYIGVYVGGGRWSEINESKEFQANGNRDHHCFPVYKGQTYRIRFESGRNDNRHGLVNVWGYYHQ